jgi:hypothetical protein
MALARIPDAFSTLAVKADAGGPAVVDLATLVGAVRSPSRLGTQQVLGAERISKGDRAPATRAQYTLPESATHVVHSPRSVRSTQTGCNSPQLGRPRARSHASERNVRGMAGYSLPLPSLLETSTRPPAGA